MLKIACISTIGGAAAFGMDDVQRRGSPAAAPAAAIQLANLGSEGITTVGSDIYTGSLFAPSLLVESGAVLYPADFEPTTGVDYFPLTKTISACGVFDSAGTFASNLLTYNVNTEATTKLDLAAATNFFGMYTNPFAFIANDLTVALGTFYRPTTYVTVATLGADAYYTTEARGLVLEVNSNDEVSVLVDSSTLPADSAVDITPKPFELQTGFDENGAPVTTTYYFGPSGIDSLAPFSLSPKLLMGAANRGEPDKALYTVSKLDGTIVPVALPLYNGIVGIDGLVVLPGYMTAAVVAYVYDPATYSVSTKILKLEADNQDWDSATVVGVFEKPAGAPGGDFAGVTYKCSNTFFQSLWPYYCRDLEVWALAADLNGFVGGGGLMAVDFTAL